MGIKARYTKPRPRRKPVTKGKRLSHADLIEAGRKWCSRSWRPPRYWDDSGDTGRGACSIVLTDITTAVSETPDVLGWCAKTSILLEAKATRSDFLGDKKKLFRSRPELGVGDLRYYITPVGLVSVDELPAGWGLIEVTTRGGVRVLRGSQHHKADKGNELVIMQSLIRRLRVQPGRHIMINAYSMDRPGKCRASVTLKTERPDDELV